MTTDTDTSRPAGTVLTWQEALAAHAAQQAASDAARRASPVFRHCARMRRLKAERAELRRELDAMWRAGDDPRALRLWIDDGRFELDISWWTPPQPKRKKFPRGWLAPVVPLR
jgi:hypothetical protein